MVSICSHCRKQAYWLSKRMIFPGEAPIELPLSDLPAECKGDYVEARSVFLNSPRSAAALLRLCLQKLMPHIGGKGKSINEDIGLLVAKGLPEAVQQAMDSCRLIGDEAVHPGELNIQDTPELAQTLFEVINFVVEEQIAKPRAMQNLLNRMPKRALDAIEKRDKGTPPTTGPRPVGHKKN